MRNFRCILCHSEHVYVFSYDHGFVLLTIFPSLFASSIFWSQFSLLVMTWTLLPPKSILSSPSVCCSPGRETWESSSKTIRGFENQLVFAGKLTFALQQQHLLRHFSTILNCWHLAKLQTPSDSFKQETMTENQRDAHNISASHHQQKSFSGSRTCTAECSNHSPTWRYHPYTTMIRPPNICWCEDPRTDFVTNYLTYQPHKVVKS